MKRKQKKWRKLTEKLGVHWEDIHRFAPLKRKTYVDFISAIGMFIMVQIDIINAFKPK